MPRKGKFLEILVKHLQEFMANEEITVTSPEEFHEDGKKIGEIDVTLRGKFGTGTIFVGIECRDRAKPQGRDWIREIYGKKNDLNVDKMIAVSSSGFAEPAINFAKEVGIDLLTIEDANCIDPNDWFETLWFGWTDYVYEISGLVDTKTSPGFPKIQMSSIKFETPFLKKPGEDDCLSIRDVMEPVLREQLGGLPLDFSEDKLSLQLNIPGPFEVEFGEVKSRAERILVPVKIKIKTNKSKALLNVCRDLSDDKIIALTGVASIEMRGEELKILAVARRNISDPSKLDLRVNFLTKEDKPFTLPEGIVMNLYGKN